MTKTETIFQPDELQSRTIDRTWSIEELFRQDGIFYLKDVLKHLNLNSQFLRKELKKLKGAGKDVYKEAGVRKIWKHWQVRMKIFAPFYRKHMVLPYQRIPKEWDSNNVLNETEGVYLLTKICQKIPFSTHQIRYQAKKNPNAKTEMGVWKDDSCNLYLVKIAVFGPWIKALWQSDFASGRSIC